MTRQTHSFLITSLSKCSKEKIKSSLDNLLNNKLIGKREYKSLLKLIKDEQIKEFK